MRPRDSTIVKDLQEKHPRYGAKYSREEDKVIREFAGVKTAEEIGIMLGRSKAGIHGRVKELGLSGILYGERHWNARVDSLRMGMVKALFDAGYTPSEVHRMFQEPLNLSHTYLTQVACGRHRKTG